MSKITNEPGRVWHRMLYSCTHMALTVGVKGLQADMFAGDNKTEVLASFEDSWRKIYTKHNTCKLAINCGTTVYHC